MGNYASFYDTSYQFIKENNNLIKKNENESKNESKNEYKNESKNEKNDKENDKENKEKETEYDYEEISVIQNILINYNNGSLSKENILIAISDYIEMNTNSNSHNRKFKIIKKFAQQFEDGIYDKMPLHL